MQISARKIDAALAADYQRMYAAAQVADAEGRVQLDAPRFAQALAEALVDPLAEQELYSQALLAAAEGHASLFENELVIEEPYMRKALVDEPAYMELRAAS